MLNKLTEVTDPNNGGIGVLSQRLVCSVPVDVVKVVASEVRSKSHYRERWKHPFHHFGITCVQKPSIRYSVNCKLMAHVTFTKATEMHTKIL